MNGSGTTRIHRLHVRLLVLLRVVVAIVLAAAATGCASLTSSVREPMRIGNTADLSPEALGLRHGATRLDEARDRLRAAGLTGIVSDEFVAPAPSPIDSGQVLAVLAADYQSRIHVFRDGRYDTSLRLPVDGALPYGFVLRLGADEKSTMLLVLHRDPLGRPTQPPELLSYRWLSGEAPEEEVDDPYASQSAVGPRFELAQRTSLADIARSHRGMTHPILVGTTFTEGALLFARDEQGRIWDKGYLVRSKAGTVELDAMPWAKAMRCSCVQNYSLQ